MDTLTQLIYNIVMRSYRIGYFIGNYSSTQATFDFVIKILNIQVMFDIFKTKNIDEWE